MGPQSLQDKGHLLWSFILSSFIAKTTRKSSVLAPLFSFLKKGQEGCHPFISAPVGVSQVLIRLFIQQSMTKSRICVLNPGSTQIRNSSSPKGILAQGCRTSAPALPPLSPPYCSQECSPPPPPKEILLIFYNSIHSPGAPRSLPQSLRIPSCILYLFIPLN